MRKDAEIRRCALVTRSKLAQVCTRRAAGRGVRAHPGLAGGQVRCEWSVLSAGCPCGISLFPLHPAAQRTHGSPFPWERPAQAGPLHRCSGQAMTPWGQATGLPLSAQPRCWEARESRAVTCGFFREMQRDRCRAWPAGQWWPRAREGRAAVLWFQVDIV